MIPTELGAIVVGAALAQQERGARVMQARVVQYDETREAQRVGPLIIVMRRIAELIDRQVIGRSPAAPDEVVRGGFGVSIHLVPSGFERRGQLGAARGNPRPDRRKRTE